METPPVQSKRDFLAIFARHPWVGLTGWLATIVALALSVVFYYSGKKERSLVYLVNPVRTTIVNGKEASALRVLYNDKEVKGDVGAVTLAIWNDGKQPIHSTDIQRPVTISFSPAQPILEAKLTPSQRDDITRVVLDVSQKEKGTVVIQWNILEHNDGVLLQLISAGNNASALRVTGTIEEQGGIRIAKKSNVAFAVPVIIASIVTFVAVLMLTRRAMVTERWWALITRTGIAALILCMAIGLLTGFLRMPFADDETLSPPFQANWPAPTPCTPPDPP
jgi:hypothetical protein